MKLPHTNLHGKHKPLRSFKELAQELNVSMARLRGLIKREGAPKPRLVHEHGAYYEVAPFKAWFRGLA